MDAYGSPDRDRTCCLLGRNQVLCPDELRSHALDSRGWPGRDRTGRLPPCHGGALPLSYRPLAAAPGFEPGPTEVTARRATVLHHAAVEERKGFEPLRQSQKAPTYLGSNQAPSARLGYLSKEEGERVERS